MPLIVITGANRGIGLELARGYAARGDEVVGVCRESSPELDGLGVAQRDGVDVADDVSVARLAQSLAGRTVDVLINNAGLLRPDRLDALDFDEVRRQFEVNTLGPLRVTRALLGALARGSKVGIVSSRVGSIGENTTGGNYGYRISKAAVNMAGVNLARDLEARGVAVVLLHPGYVRTGMTGGSGSVGPAQAARGLMARLDELSLEASGTFRHAEGYELSW